MTFPGKRFPFLLTLMLALAAPGLALGAPPCKGPHANDPGCDSGGGGGGGGGTPPSDVDVQAWWVGDNTWPTLAYDDDERLCTAESLSTDGGNYHCQHVPGVYDGVTHFDLTGVAWEQTHRRGDPTMCDALNGISMQANGIYTLAWSGDCKASGGCTLRIINAFSGSDVADAVAAVLGPNAPRTDQVVVNAYADVNLAVDDDANPYAGHLLVEMHTFTASFTLEGKSKTLATCEYDMAGSPAPAIFESTPVP